MRAHKNLWLRGRVQCFMKLIIKMQPYASYYLGEEIDSIETPFPHSDTLFQAINHAWVNLWGEESQRQFIGLYQHNNTIPLTITSIFPCIKDVYFVPCPLSLSIPTNYKNAVVSSKFVRWISATIYRDWIEGKEITYNIKQFLQPNLYIHNKEIEKIIIEPQTPYWAHDGRVRNRVDTITTATKTYPAKQIYYNSSLFWYLVADVLDVYQEKFIATLRLLGDEGIGGRRSIGCGAFSISAIQTIPEELNFLNAPITKTYTIFSLYYPQPQEIQDGLFNTAIYELIQRQPCRKNYKNNQTIVTQQLNLLREGSQFFTITSAQALIDITPTDWPNFTYVYGYPFRVIATGARHE